MKNLLLFLSTSSLVFLFSCKLRNNNETASPQEFERAAPVRVSPGSFRLTRAEDVPYQSEIVQFDFSRNPAVPDYERHSLQGRDLVHLGFNFGKLTQPQFDKLRKNYGTPPSVIHRSDYNYRLEDFLQFSIRALVGLRFVIQNQEARQALAEGMSMDRSIETQTNCWSTAYEVARNSPDNFTLFYTDDWNIQKVLANDMYGRRIKQLSPKDVSTDPASVKNRNLGMQPGDILLVYQSARQNPSAPAREYLMHAAVFVDDDLYFEKTGTMSNYLFRFTTYQEISRDYGDDPGTGYFGSRFEVRRFREPGKASIPPPEVVFGNHNPIYKDKVGKVSDLVKRNTMGCDMVGLAGGSKYYYCHYVNFRFDFSNPIHQALLPRSAFSPATYFIQGIK